MFVKWETISAPDIFLLNIVKKCMILPISYPAFYFRYRKAKSMGALMLVYQLCP